MSPRCWERIWLFVGWCLLPAFVRLSQFHKQHGNGKTAGFSSYIYTNCISLHLTLLLRDCIRNTVSRLSVFDTPDWNAIERRTEHHKQSEGLRDTTTKNTVTAKSEDMGLLATRISVSDPASSSLWKQFLPWSSPTSTLFTPQGILCSCTAFTRRKFRYPIYTHTSYHDDYLYNLPDARGNATARFCAMFSSTSTLLGRTKLQFMLDSSYNAPSLKISYSSSLPSHFFMHTHYNNFLGHGLNLHLLSNKLFVPSR